MSKQITTIKVQDQSITVLYQKEDDHISLTDIAHIKI